MNLCHVMNNTLIAVGMAIATSSVVTLPLVTSLVNRRINSENANSQPLRQNEERFRSLVQNSSDIITILDRNGIIIYESPSVEPILGYESEELLGKNKFDYVHPEDLLSVQAAFDKVIQNHGNVVSIENRFRHKDGSWVYLECVANNLLDDASVKGIVINSRDITERKQAELALQKQTEREHLMGAIAQRIRQSLNLEEILQTTVAEVRQFLETDRVVIYRFQENCSGVVVVESVNSEASPLLGTVIYDPGFAQAYVQLHNQGSVKARSDMYTAGLTHPYIELLAQYQVKANLVVPILQNEQTIQNPKSKCQNHLWGLLVAHHCSSSREWQQFEIDLLKQLATQVAIAIQQSELYQQVQQLNADLERQVQERTRELQKALDFDAMLKRITDKVRDSLDESHILQTAVQELAIGLGLNSCDTVLYENDDKTSTIRYEYTTSSPSNQGCVVQIANFPEGYHQLLQGQSSQFCAFHAARGWVAMLACPIFDDQGILGDLWLCNHREYAFNELEIRLVEQVANQCAIAIRQARLYQAVQAQVKELERLNRLKDDFLSTVSHELRTPVANMKMAMQMLAIALKQERALNTEMPNTEAQQSKTARYLQILKNECERESTLINDILDLQRLNAKSQSLVLTAMQLQDWIPQVVEPFCERIRNQQQSLQVNISTDLPALVSDPSSLERIVAELLNNACKYTPPGEEITVTAFAKAGKMQICVSNSGVEIAASELNRIFDKFYRIPSGDPWKRGGTGLGLALVKQLTEYLGGTIWVESASGETCFKVEFPIKCGVSCGA